MVLPELGGRIHVGFDKTVGYDFFYRNNVIKPALVGLTGPWISGGVEFNWPQHHRPATFLPVEFDIEEHPDGSVTVWCSDHDPFTRMKGMHGIRLRPDRASVELVVRLHNRTSETQTFLWWANAAARVHDDYQSFFPTDVRYVADHARRAITAFPAADRPYYGVDYPARKADGRDRLDFYRNIPVPTSYMVVGTQDDFFGGYDHAAGAGFVHVADRRIAPGKKQWTWGDAAFGHAWDDLLTDGDGPYIELMAGAYTDNQPDFSWLAPGETKAFTQTWYPIQGIGVVHQANLDAAMHLEVSDGRVRLGVSSPAVLAGATVELFGPDGVLLHWSGDVGPGRPFVDECEVGELNPHELELVLSHHGAEVLRWKPRTEAEAQGEPDVATEPPSPNELESVEELYLTGVHLAQYRHPTRSPLPYWKEALRRDPGDVRSNVALADCHYRSGDYALAVDHLGAALARLTARNGNPSDGEAHYLLGLVLGRLGRESESYDALAKAAWDRKWAHPATVEMARQDARAGRNLAALERVRAARRLDADDSRARGLEAVLLARLGHESGARALLANTLKTDHLDQLARELAGLPLSGDPRTLVDVALELASFGETGRAVLLLERAAAAQPTAAGNMAPIALYHLASILDGSGDAGAAVSARLRARGTEPDRCFPFGIDDHDALVAAIKAEPTDGRAHALLAMLLFDRGRESDALFHWRQAIAAGLTDPVLFRNAAIATFNSTGDGAAALALYSQALELAPRDSRLWYESDQLLARLGTSAADRLARLEPQLAQVLARDDLTVEWCDLLVAAGRAAEALDVLSTRSFAPWEGGEGRTLAAWEHACLALASQSIPEEALQLTDLAIQPPHSLGEARHELASIAHILRARATALDALGRSAEAAAVRSQIAAEPAPAVSDGDKSVDYFATSLPDLLLFN
jgi:tetratricopeptide (TPR) repeat protein